MESVWNDFAKLVGRVLAERWLRRQGLVDLTHKTGGAGRKASSFPGTRTAAGKTSTARTRQRPVR